jgi:type II restriction enzyme
MLTGNKGEWSEIYVFLKLLADGKLHAADASLNAISNVYYPILKILRQEGRAKREYRLNGNIRIFDGNSGVELFVIPISDFIKVSNNLFDRLKAAEGRSFAFEDIEEFLHNVDINSLTALKTDKADIRVVVHDLNTGLKPELGFSIKSLLGSNSTLFNPGHTTNFIFEIIGDNINPLDINAINKIQETPKIANRLTAIKNAGFNTTFIGIKSKTLKLNLQLIDSDLPEILAELLLLKYSLRGTSSLTGLVEKLIKSNPLNFDLALGHPFYEYKIKNFLTDCALGMTPATLWTGKYNATGGIIIVKENGELVCYHIYNRNEFQDYLFNSTRLEQASTTRYGFGDLYMEKGRVYLLLNLQIRFN